MEEKFKVYVAAPWTHKDTAAEVAALFEQAGFAITRDWWKYDNETDPDLALAQCAYDDVVGVVEADIVIVLNLEKSEGKSVETGIALACMKSIIVVGERSNIFHHLEAITMVPTVEEALDICIRRTTPTTEV